MKPKDYHFLDFQQNKINKRSHEDCRRALEQEAREQIKKCTICTTLLYRT